MLNHNICPIVANTNTMVIDGYRNFRFCNHTVFS